MLAERGLIHDEVAGTNVIVVASEDGKGGRAYESSDVSFTSLVSNGDALASSDGREWSITEDALTASDGAELARLPGHNSFWFAIVNHTTNWRLYQSSLWVQARKALGWHSASATKAPRMPL